MRAEPKLPDIFNAELSILTSLFPAGLPPLETIAAEGEEFAEFVVDNAPEAPADTGAPSDIPPVEIPTNAGLPNDLSEDLTAVIAPPLEADDDFAPNVVIPVIEFQSAKPTEGPGSGGGGGGNGNKGGNDDDGDTGDNSDPSVLDSYISGGDAATSFNIEIIFNGTWTVDLQQAFIDAADLISSIITGDITNVRFRKDRIDDIKIEAELVDIDGPGDETGNILGQAGPTSARLSSNLPATAIMEFDIYDAETYDSQFLFNDIVFHEMMHSIGFGTMWDAMGLVDDPNGDQSLLLFTGANATAENGGSNVLIETDGGPGTAGGHWDETAFTNEIMTGYIDDPNYLSTISVAAIEDMGYETIYGDGGVDVAAVLADDIFTA